jgi:hypothetical protein
LKFGLSHCDCPASTLVTNRRLADSLKSTRAKLLPCCGNETRLIKWSPGRRPAVAEQPPQSTTTTSAEMALAAGLIRTS